MTLIFSYQFLPILGRAEYQLTDKSNNVVTSGLSFRALTSNFFQEPLKAYIIWNVSVLENAQLNDPGTIIITDGQSNNIGSITFYNYYQLPSIDSVNLAKTTNQSISYAITIATGILSDYLNGTVVIDYCNPDTRTLYLFKR